MGLDMNPLPKPMPGHEEQFRDLFFRIEVETSTQRDEKPGLSKKLVNLLGVKKRKIDRLTREFQEISIPAHASIGAPVIGKDESANNWLRELYESGQMTGANSADEALEKMTGYHVLELLPDCDGFPVYSNGNMYEGIDRTSFRGSFLRDCEEVIGSELMEQAWHSMLADKLEEWAAAIREKCHRFAKRQGTEDVLGDKSFDFDDESVSQSQTHIVDQAARWAFFWSARGHGSEAYW